MSNHGQRSDAARAYRHLYDTAAWKRLREWKLRKDPLCAMCSQQGLTTQATTVNHRIPHQGNAALFFDARNLDSLCKPHHDGPVQSAERTGVERGCDANGMPNDPRSHWRTMTGEGGQILGDPSPAAAADGFREENHEIPARI